MSAPLVIDRQPQVQTPLAPPSSTRIPWSGLSPWALLGDWSRADSRRPFRDPRRDRALVWSTSVACPPISLHIDAVAGGDRGGARRPATGNWATASFDRCSLERLEHRIRRVSWPRSMMAAVCGPVTVWRALTAWCRAAGSGHRFSAEVPTTNPSCSPTSARRRPRFPRAKWSFFARGRPVVLCRCRGPAWVATVDQAPEQPDAAFVQGLLDSVRQQVRATVTDGGAHFRRSIVADRYVAGRIVLAGDAAHVHSPAGGQGRMNMGMPDAVHPSGALVEAAGAIRSP